jgi:hypothetical protein
VAADQGEDWLGRFLIGRRLGFRGTGAGGADAAQGHAEAIRRASAAGGGGHGGRRGLRRLLPHGVVTLPRRERGKGGRKETDWLGPHVSRSGGGVGGKQAAKPKGQVGWRFRRAWGCWRGLSNLRCGPRCKGPFPIFLNPSSYLNYDSNLN